jgi:glutaredoxin 3
MVYLKPMLNLYYKESCPYCQRVLKANAVIKADLNLLDVFTNEALRDELVAKGGKRQVPFLEDTSRGVMMYESEDIITYLKEQYGQDEEIIVPEVKNVCPIE